MPFLPVWRAEAWMYRYKRYRHKEAGERVILETGIDGKTMGRTTERTVMAGTIGMPSFSKILSISSARA